MLEVIMIQKILKFIAVLYRVRQELSVEFEKAVTHKEVVDINSKVNTIPGVVWYVYCAVVIKRTVVAVTNYGKGVEQC
jgi:hypothetical protein